MRFGIWIALRLAQENCLLGSHDSRDYGKNYGNVSSLVYGDHQKDYRETAGET